MTRLPEVIYEDEDWIVTGIRKGWWSRTYDIPRVLVWIAIPQIIISAFNGIYYLVSWLS